MCGYSSGSDFVIIMEKMRNIVPLGRTLGNSVLHPCRQDRLAEYFAHVCHRSLRVVAELASCFL